MTSLAENSADVSEITGQLEKAQISVKGPEKLVDQFSNKEKSAIAEVSRLLLKSEKEGGMCISKEDVRPREVAMVTLITKLRVEKAVAKYKQLLDVLKQYGLSMSSLYENEELLLAKLGDKWAANYLVAGVDKGGRSAMWLSASEPSKLSEEQTVVHSGIMYWQAVHSDITTLRDGCTFVIDTSKQKVLKKVGNERKLQKTWQSLPLRPQNLFIVGASFLRKIFLNALISFASVFSNSKVLARIQFVEMDSVKECFDPQELPHELGGHKRPDVSSWIFSRLRAYDGVEI